MNRMTLIGLLICGALSLLGCQATEHNTEPKNVTLSLSTQSIEIECEAFETNISVSSDGDWGVSAKDDWVKVSPNGGGAGTTDVKVRIGANDGKSARSSQIVFITRSSKTQVAVKQNCKPEEPVDDSIIAPEGYTLVWNDEFNDPSIDMPDEKWWYENAEPGWVNNELQTYIPGKKANIQTALISDGTLKIKAIKDGARVYSARVNTKEGWTYGYFEARLKLPKGKGTWPAFWMMPTVWSGWPDGGEIDIMEHVGCVPTEVSSSIHCKAYYHAINTQKTAARKIASVMDEFHIYALEWTPEYIKTYVDGKLLLSYNPDNYPLGRNAQTWPFDKPFQLKLNLAWGGDWGGMYGVDESCLPAVYEIDYVRVFQIK